MKISLNWLRDYVDMKVSVEKLTEALTMAGVEIEHVETSGKDTILTAEITPNRPDCLNLLGLARDIAAVLRCQLKKTAVKKIARLKAKVGITIQDPKDCCRYIGTLIENVKIALAPLWMTERLMSIGLRPINNVVDITNFTLFENGQPLHAFDYDKLKGGKIIVRRAKKGEKIITIDGVERELDPSILVIADAERPVAIAGIMGGKETEVTASTKRVLLESAYFDPLLIRRASRKLGLFSDSSYRFERGVVFETVETGADRALALILESANGTITKRWDAIVADKKFKAPKIKFTPDDMNRFLGAQLTAKACREALKALDFLVEAKGRVFKVAPPYFRADVLRFEDVCEEIARVVGYNNLPGSLPRVCMVNVRPDEQLKKRADIKTALLAQGLNETITFTMISRKAIQLSSQENIPAVAVKNPLSQDQEVMRPTMLSSLLTVVQTNLHRGQKDLRFFEIGKIYPAGGEKETLAMILAGKRSRDWRDTSKARMDFFDVKAAVEAAVNTVLAGEIVFDPTEEKFLEVGQTAGVILRKKKIGVIGKVSADVLTAWDIKTKDVFFAQIDLQELYNIKGTEKKYQPLIEFPAVGRDISIALQKEIPFSRIREIAFSEGGAILKNVDLIEEYYGEKITADQRGLVFSLTYQSLERTLREEEVNAIHEKIVARLMQDLGAVRR